MPSLYTLVGDQPRQDGMTITRLPAGVTWTADAPRWLGPDGTYRRDGDPVEPVVTLADVGMIGQTLTCTTGTWSGPVTIGTRIYEPTAEPEIPEGWTKHDGQSRPQLLLGAWVKILWRDGSADEAYADEYQWLWDEDEDASENILAYLVADDGKVADTPQPVLAPTGNQKHWSEREWSHEAHLRALGLD